MIYDKMTSYYIKFLFSASPTSVKKNATWLLHVNYSKINTQICSKIYWFNLEESKCCAACVDVAEDTVSPTAFYKLKAL